MDEYLENEKSTDITTAELDYAIGVLYKKGHLFEEDDADKQYYHIIYALIDEVNEFYAHFGIRTVINKETNNIYLINIQNANFSLVNRVPLSRTRSVMLVILAIRLWQQKDLTQPVTISKEDLYREFFMYIPKDGNKKNADSTFSGALDYCLKSGFIRTVPDDSDMFLILPYLKCRVTAEEIHGFKEQLEKIKKPVDDNTVSNEEGSVFSE